VGGTWENADTGPAGGARTARQTYTVVRHDRLQRAWCLRLPITQSPTDGFVAYLFLDLRCDAGTPMPRSTDRYVWMTLTRDEHDGHSLCVDDYEACSYWASPCLKTVQPRRLLARCSYQLIPPPLLACILAAVFRKNLF